MNNSSADTVDSTLAFYEQNAQTYAHRSRTLPKARLDDFLAQLPIAGSILDLGCGGGQDSQYMISQNFSVTSVDGSSQMARQAEKLLKRPVTVLQFQDLDAREEFNGVWAHASLLHVPRNNLSSVVGRVKTALKDDGIFYASFKSGENEGTDQFDRYYNYPSEEFLTVLFSQGLWRDHTITQSIGGGYDGKPTSWLHVTAKK